jgi:hypothetical protein
MEEGQLMGLSTALEIADMNIPIEEQVHFHLMTNIFPRPPVSMVAVSVEAIEAYLEDKPYRVLTMPDGVMFRGSNKADAIAIIDVYRLGVFIPDEDED